MTFIEMILAGESTGNLSAAFAAMRDHFDKQVKSSAKVRSAMAYPAFVIAVAIVVVAVLMIVVIPKFLVMFEDMDVELPGITKALIAIVNFFTNYYLYLAAVIAAIVTFYILYSRTEKGKINLAKLSLKLPILGEIQQLNGSAQFSSTMAAMLGAGLPMTKAMSITARVLENYYLRTEAVKLTEQIETGRGLAECMAEQGVYQDILVDMCAVGEQSGELDKTLRTVSAYYDAELDEATKRALGRLEPALLVFIAGFAGFIVIAIYMAIFAIYGGM